jgi:hypothetical protein
MTNYEKFQIVTEELESPDSYLYHAFHFAVSSALERRVFFGHPARPTYLNQYLLFVGPPAIGKGVAMREALRLLEHFPLTTLTGDIILDPYTQKPRKLFYRLPDSTTFEQLVAELACSTVIFQPAGQADAVSHASAYFLLEELSSIMRIGKSEDLCRLLLNLYDCQPFTYATKRSGRAVLEKGCLNFCAGTVEGFLTDAEKSGILAEGMLSRSIVVCESKARRHNFFSHTMNGDQEALLLDLQKHLWQLSRLHGPVGITEEAIEWLTSWWPTEAARIAAFDNDAVGQYFGRRKMHLIKLAAAIHFADSFDMTLTLPAFQRAADELRLLEPNVIQLAIRSGKNEVYQVQAKFYKWLQKEPAGRSLTEVLKWLQPHLAYQDSSNMLMQAQASGDIEIIESNDGQIYRYVKGAADDAPIVSVSNQLPPLMGV